MNKFVLLLSLLSLAAHINAQPGKLPSRQEGKVGETVQQVGSYAVDGALILPARNDTNFVPYRIGAIMLRTTDNNWYAYDSIAGKKRWRRMPRYDDILAIFSNGSSGDTLLTNPGADTFLFKSIANGYGITQTTTATTINQKIDTTSANSLVTKYMLSLVSGTGATAAESPIYIQSGGPKDTIKITESDSTHNGYLRYNDWIRFNRAGYYTPVGQIYNKASFTNSDLTNDFTNSGATVSVVNGTLHFSGGAGNYNQALGLTQYGFTAMEHWRISGDVRIISGGSGPGFGIRSDLVSGNTIDCAVQLNTLNGDISLGTNGTTLKVGYIAFSVGDSISISVERNVDILVAKLRNITTNGTEVIVTAGLTIPPHRTGLFSVFSFGGTFEVANLNVYSLEMKYPKVGIISDSRGVGIIQNISTYTQGYASQMKDNFELTNLSCGGDATDEVLLRLQEILAIHPDQCILSLNFNDLGRNSLSQYLINYDSITETLTNDGIEVFHAPLFSIQDSATLRIWRDSVEAHYPTTFINAFDVMAKDLTTISSDLIHPSPLGYSVIYNAILRSSFISKAKGQHITTDNAYIQNNPNTQSAQFHVSQPSSIDALLTIGSATASAPQLVIKTASDTRVTIGETSGANRLISSSNSYNADRPWEYVGSTHTFMDKDNISKFTIDAAGNATVLGRLRVGTGALSGSVAMQVQVASNKNWLMYSPTGNEAELLALNNGFTGEVAGSIYATPLTLGTYNSVGTRFPVITMPANNRVGIGTTNPLQKLHVAGKVVIDTLPTQTAGTDSIVTVNSGVLGKIAANSYTGIAGFVVNETATGSTSSTYTLANTPLLMQQVFKNGILLLPVTDYSVSGTTVTLVSARLVTDVFNNFYIK